MNNTKLIQLIRESINEYIREIDHAGEEAAVSAKIAKIGEAIELREKKITMDGIDEAYHDMIDKGKMKELSGEVKALKKSLAKYEKQLEKLKNKGAKKVEDTEEKEIVDENEEFGPSGKVTLAPKLKKDYEEDEEFGPSGKVTLAPKLKKDYEEDEERYDADGNLVDVNEMNIYEVLHMQKLAGIISETEYKVKVEEAKKKMTTAQKEKKEDIVKGMKKSKSFGKSKDEKSKMYATATKLATKKKAKGLKEEVQALFEDKLSQIETSIQQEYPEIIEDGEIETGTEEWLFLLQLAFKTYGLNIANEYDIFKAINGKGPYAQQVKDLGYTPIRALEAALKNLGVDII